MNTYTEDDLRAALARDADAGSPALDVWPRLHRRIIVRRRVRAGVAAGAIAAAAAVLVVVLPPDHKEARLPVAGSHAVTLVPDRPLSSAEMQTAVDILRHRIDALGVQHATIETHGDAVTVDASGTTRADIAAIAVRGVLQYRSVTAISTAADGAVHYTLGKVALGNDDVHTAEAFPNTSDNSWLVVVDFDRAGAQKFHSLTADAADKPLPNPTCGPPRGCNAIAIVLDGTVLSAPSVQQRGGIRAGQTQIAAALTKEQATSLAALVQAPPLPTAFTVS